MNKFKRYKPDFDSEEGRKLFYNKVWDLIKYLFILCICLFVCFFVTFWAVVSNRNDNESAFAEVSDLEYNTTYYFSSCRVPSGYTFMNSVNTSSWSGVLTFDNVSYSFDLISCQYMKTGVNYTYNLWFSLSGTTVYQLRFSSSSPYNLIGTGINSSNLVQRTPEAFSSATISFSAFNSSYSSITQFFKVNLSVYVPPVLDHRPDLRGLYNYELNGIYTNFDFNTQNTTYSTYTNDLYAFEVYNLDSTQLTAVGTSFYTFEIAYSAGHYNVSTDTYTTNSGVFTGYAPYSPSPIGYITIAVDLSYWNLFSLYYPEYSNDDDNQLDISYDDSETNLLWRQIKANYDSIHDMNNDSRSTRSAYLQGYEAGTNADKTLLSVMWQTFNLPFRLLFGTYDDVQSSPTYGRYVGGLFNFTILGVDIRAFCIGIMSFAIVLAVVRFVLGAKGA